MIEIKQDDINYPQTLRNIQNPPKKLFLEGNIELLNSTSIAIIGSRNCSENGKKLTKLFASKLSICGITIVSGLAVGIDSVAHLSSYNKNGKTIAVLGSGLNKIYPSENIDLYRKIINNGGLIISEYSPNVEAQSSFFLKRNRIVSGLSLGVLVIEAKHRSGTSVTAKIAKSQNRAVFAVPHEIWDSCGVGTNRLIKEGATLVTSPLDILDYLKISTENYLSLESNNISSNSNNFSKLKNEILDNPFFSDEKQATIYKTIKEQSTPITINELVLKTHLTVNEVMSSLFMLELNEHIKKVEYGYI